LEISTGAGRRRSWSAEQKARIVTESLAGGESVSAVARRHGLTPQQLFTWRRQARGGSAMGRLGFASVEVAPSTIEIEFGGATIRVSARQRCDDATGGAAGREGGGVIVPSGAVRVLVATRPVDFRNYAEHRIMLSPRQPLLQRRAIPVCLLRFDRAMSSA